MQMKQQASSIKVGWVAGAPATSTRGAKLGSGQPSLCRPRRPCAFAFADRAAPVLHALAVGWAGATRGNVRSRSGAPPSAGVGRDERAGARRRDLRVCEADEGDPLVVRVAVEVQRLMNQHPVDVEAHLRHAPQSAASRASPRLTLARQTQPSRPCCRVSLASSLSLA